VKIDKYISDVTGESRRKVKELLKQKRVLHNGKPATLKTEVAKGDEVLMNGEKVIAKKIEPIYLAYHKPKGIICTTEKIKDNIINAIQHPEKIYPVGRLDKDSEGLILLTNQRGIMDKITNSDNDHEKEYIVTLNLPVRNQFLKEISEGVEILGQKTKPCVVKLEPNAKRIFRIILTQGLNRQIRRMCNAYDYQVLKLQRIRVMNVELGKLKPGECRNLTEQELDGLLEAL
jgi:23S rRNA pseudouridine2604 synthase